MKNPHVDSLVALLLPLATTAAQVEPAATPTAPAAMTLEQLLLRPERWPLQCKMLKQYDYGEERLTLEDSYPVLDLRATEAIIELKNGKTGLVPLVDTTVLAAANANFESMSPAQRLLDLEMLKKRADLWPDKIAMRCSFTTGEGSMLREFRKGAELDFGTFDGTFVKARHPEYDSTPALRLFNTDLVERVRKALDAKPRTDGHRVLADLDGKLLSLRTGKKTRLNPKNPPDYVLLYFSAGWCGPCREFSPKLVQFYQLNKKAAGKRFEIIWISRDQNEQDMQEYAKTYGFPWLAVAFDKLGSIPIAQAHDLAGIPDLVMLDANGALIADSYVGSDYRGADSVLEVLKERLSKPR